MCTVHTPPRGRWHSHVSRHVGTSAEAAPVRGAASPGGIHLPHIPRGRGADATSPGRTWQRLRLSLPRQPSRESRQDGPVRFYIYLSNTFSIFLP